MQTETINKLDLNIELKELINKMENINSDINLYNIIVDEQLQLTEV